ncbi:MAG: hypothetical protein FJZ80_04305 [Bacteroidetes bacterium]|nr:hypothetical protein [Bacteroidota bacterium]
MKRILIATLALVIGYAAQAQGNLQFNQVKLVTTVETVPVGKVWKVEAVLGQRSVSGTTTFHQTHDVIINGITVNFTQDLSIARATGSGNTFGASAEGVSTVPFWLPAGSTLAISNNVSFISVLEYNIVP